MAAGRTTGSETGANKGDAGDGGDVGSAASGVNVPTTPTAAETPGSAPAEGADAKVSGEHAIGQYGTADPTSLDPGFDVRREAAAKLVDDGYTISRSGFSGGQNVIVAHRDGKNTQFTVGPEGGLEAQDRVTV